MGNWLNSASGIIITVCGLGTAIVVFVNHILSIRRLRMEIKALELKIEENRRLIKQPTAEETQKYGKSIERFVHSVAESSETFHILIDVQQRLRKQVCELCENFAELSRRTKEFEIEVREPILNLTDALQTLNKSVIKTLSVPPTEEAQTPTAPRTSP